MHNRLFGGNGSSKGFTNGSRTSSSWGRAGSCSWPASPTRPGAEELPYALSQGLEQWLRSQPAVRVRSPLPIMKGGDTIARRRDSRPKRRAG